MNVLIDWALSKGVNGCWLLCSKFAVMLPHAFTFYLGQRSHCVKHSLYGEIAIYTKFYHSHILYVLHNQCKDFAI